MHHGLELTGPVGPVLPGQTAVLVVDQLQVGQSFLNLPLETLDRNQGQSSQTCFCWADQQTPETQIFQLELQT